MRVVMEEKKVCESVVDDELEDEENESENEKVEKGDVISKRIEEGN
jgi:hypothetical protein